MNSTTDLIKVHIQIGNCSITYEGPGDSLSGESIETLRELSTVIVEHATTEPQHAESGTNQRRSNGEVEFKPLQMTTGTVAGRLHVKTGTELVIAAASKLTLADGKETFKRSELLAEMKTAPSYFKETFRKNLSNSLSTLIKNDQIREIAPDTYAIEARTKQSLLTKLTD